LDINTVIMDLQLSDRFFIVLGAGSGFGRAIAEQLLLEGASVLAVARTESILKAFKAKAGDKLSILAGDITQAAVQQEVFLMAKDKKIDGALINAGGPPAKAFMETELFEWDEAYRSLLRWKVAFVQELTDVMLHQQYGRIVFIESLSVKQPVENLVLSNSLRLAVVGFVKSLAADVASKGVTLNVLAPGYHNTAAMQRLFDKMASIKNTSIEEAKSIFENKIPVGKMGEATDMAMLAVWLLSPMSRYVTGQTISHDGGSISGIFG